MRMLLSWAILGTLLLVLGCNSGSRSSGTQEGAKLSGKVTFEGKPVTGGIIKLHPAKGNPIMFPIGPDGSYISASNLPTGQMGVSIDTESTKTAAGGSTEGAKGSSTGSSTGGREAKTTDPEMARLMGQLKKPQYVEIPAKYKDPSTSGLSVTIAKGEQTKDFDLKP